MIEWLALALVLFVGVWMAWRLSGVIADRIDRARHRGEYPWQRDYRRWKHTLATKHMDEKGKWR